MTSEYFGRTVPWLPNAPTICEPSVPFVEIRTRSTEPGSGSEHICVGYFCGFYLYQRPAPRDSQQFSHGVLANQILRLQTVLVMLSKTN